MVPRVRKYLEQHLGLDEPTRMKWIGHWVDLASEAVEKTLARDERTGKFCVGDQVTVADLCLAAHLTSAKVLLGRNPSDYPNAGRIYATCMAMDAFSSEHPLRQPVVHVREAAERPRKDREHEKIGAGHSRRADAHHA